MRVVKYWHRNLRVWVVYEQDTHGNQVGDARYYANKTAMILGENASSTNH